ncbi:hypothetical protein CKN73_12935 [Carnobacterium divergens]|uniref:hypothetical protein n=1 Tax=Carnobacterium divergens TaxID=2748 RepID=UPI0010725605|nr:hypothetical protein [Carnobacterium divergens]TFJ39085.1 hypothetical protein CKN77_13030 [Carnobacterium divergens]TFJ48320.1 hypothetical protein CKN73_12935 [Carnobacterium divergens]TFJ53284.1 hypothetical protein CKN83_12835 [Carnobacterium divergens]TFJ57371.1 hypothetical protein CKN89_13275 [Carnobacterium divergens]TFJ69073.1 hypothetical protein CKN91_12890 [Carnobacterium divergens]
MDNIEYKNKYKQLEEQYYQEKRDIQRQQKKLDEQVVQFRRETNQLVDKVMYLTKNDDWNKQQFYRNMEESEVSIRQEGRRYSQQLEEEQLTKSYRKDLENLDEQRQAQR